MPEVDETSTTAAVPDRYTEDRDLYHRGNRDLTNSKHAAKCGGDEEPVTGMFEVRRLEYNRFSIHIQRSFDEQSNVLYLALMLGHSLNLFRPCSVFTHAHYSFPIAATSHSIVGIYTLLYALSIRGRTP